MATTFRKALLGARLIWLAGAVFAVAAVQATAGAPDCPGDRAAEAAAAHPAIAAYCADPSYHGCSFRTRDTGIAEAGSAVAWFVVASLIHSFDDEGNPRFMPEGVRFIDISSACEVLRVWDHGGQIFPKPAQTPEGKKGD